MIPVIILSWVLALPGVIFLLLLICDNITGETKSKETKVLPGYCNEN